MQGREDLATHAVANQPPPRGDRDLWADDPVLRDHLMAGKGQGGAGQGGAGQGVDRAILAAQGATLGRAEMAEAAREANRVLPELRQFDAGGRRLDEVRFHPAYHRFLDAGLSAGYAARPWTGGTHLTHAAMVYLHSQVEPGTCCPMTMTYAAVPALAGSACAAEWLPKLTAACYDPAVAPLSAKAAATLGMAMTEKQGGSDLRANTTRAEATADGWRLSGHKWFCSAPMSDGFLTLAQAPEGLCCFLVPRWLEDGTRNAIHLMRLKDKLGNRANASAEIEYHGARALPVGPGGRGIATILAMVHHTRLDTAMAPAGLMRAALDHAWHWTRHRHAFGARLIDQPLMRTVLADLVLDWEGAVALGLAVARAFDTPAQAPFARIAVALAKFLNNRLALRVIAEAMEVLGGMGYVEDTPLPMLYREAPLNGIWEGSGNVICLDILRTLSTAPEARAALEAALDAARGGEAAYDAGLAAFRARWPALPEPAEARAYAERAARLLTASVLIARAPDAVAGAYAATRIGGREMPGDVAALLARLGPA